MRGDAWTQLLKINYYRNYKEVSSFSCNAFYLTEIHISVRYIYHPHLSVHQSVCQSVCQSCCTTPLKLPCQNQRYFGLVLTGGEGCARWSLFVFPTFVWPWTDLDLKKNIFACHFINIRARIPTFWHITHFQKGHQICQHFFFNDF